VLDIIDYLEKMPVTQTTFGKIYFAISEGDADHLTKEYSSLKKFLNNLQEVDNLAFEGDVYKLCLRAFERVQDPDILQQMYQIVTADQERREEIEKLLGIHNRPTVGTGFGFALQSTGFSTMGGDQEQDNKLTQEQQFLLEEEKSRLDAITKAFHEHVTHIMSRSYAE
jgi:hypothetical protein